MVTPSGLWTVNFDGGSIGNPGPSAAAAVLVGPEGRTLKASRYLPHATNNQAEYAGLLCALHLAIETGVEELLVLGDSALVINQLNGTWKAKDASMIESLAEAKELARSFRSLEARWIPREENGAADEEVRRCLGANKVAPVVSTEVPADLPERYQSGKFAALNRKSPGQASFQDLAGVRVGGQDEFSRKKRDALLDLLGSDAAAAETAIAVALTAGKANLSAELVRSQHEKLELTALRWTARGLRPELAGQKVLVDLELSINAARKRR